MRMLKLISKVQYKRSEKGEFHDVAERSVEELISVVLNYPWEIERSFTPVELTCPSVTIEHPVGTFLKVGPYFSGKFALYYLDASGKVYMKTASTLEDVCVWIIKYYEQDGQLEGFDKYGFVISPQTHFQTNPFEYMVNAHAVRSFFHWTIWMLVVMVVVCGLFYLERPLELNYILPLVLLLLVFVMSSPLIYLFFNYKSADQNNYLQISRGHQEFLFGKLDNRQVYNKRDITSIHEYGVNNSRSTCSDCSIFVIDFTNDEQIKFTSLLISQSTFKMKFPDHQIEFIGKYFPTVGRIKSKTPERLVDVL
jgi:hypothetical protein